MSNKTLSSRGRQEAQSKRAGRFRGSSINLFYLPAVILLAVFIVYPLFSGIGLSLTNWDGYSPEKTFIGLTNFAQMFKSASFSSMAALLIPISSPPWPGSNTIT